MILHIPHSAIKMLDGVEVKDLIKNQFMLTDWYTDELFYHESAEPIVFPYSRFSVDVERLEENDPMDKYGMGILYKNDVFGYQIKRYNKDCMNIYHDHHHKLNQTVNKYLSYFEKVFIVDCHSFSDEHFDWTSPDLYTLPDICIGVDETQTPMALVNDLTTYFKQFFSDIRVNEPYSGTIIPSWFVNNNNVCSIMIEVNKNLYMDGDYKNNSFEKIQKILTDGLGIIHDYEN